MTVFLSSVYRNKMLWALGILLAFVLFGMSILQLNALTSSAFHVAQAEQQLVGLKHGNTALQHRAYQTVSFRELEQLARQRNFERTTSVTYIRQVSGGVAQNQ